LKKPNQIVEAQLQNKGEKQQHIVSSVESKGSVRTEDYKETIKINRTKKTI